MSRIRTIKPDFWTSEQIIECSPNARLLFIGLWNFCDDAGRHSWSPRQIRAQVFPGDHFTTDEVSRMLDELSTNDLIRRYAVDGKEYLYVTGWHHQKIDRPQKPTCPAPLDEHSTNARDGREGKGEEGNTRSLRSRESRAPEPPPPAEPLPPSAPEPSCRIEFDMTFWPAYPHKVGRPAALRAFIAKRQAATLAEIMDGLARYKSDRPPDRQWLNPATFLNDERFRDDPAPSPVPNGTRPNGHDAIFRALAEQASGPPRQRERDPRPDGIDDAERGGASADFDARGAVQIEADAEP